MLVVCLLLTAFRWPTVLENTNANISRSFEFRDERPETQLKSGFESLMITSCAYSSIRIGARDIEPDSAALIADQLATKLNPLLSGRIVTLKNFTVHLNNVAGMRATMGQTYTGLIPDLMNNQAKVGCAPDDLRGGYVLGEVPADKVPLIVVIDIAVENRIFHARCLKPYPYAYPVKKNAAPEFKAGWNAAVSQATSCALESVIQQMNQAFSDSPIPAENKVDAAVAVPAVTEKVSEVPASEIVETEAKTEH